MKKVKVSQIKLYGYFLHNGAIFKKDTSIDESVDISTGKIISTRLGNGKTILICINPLDSKIKIGSIIEIGKNETVQLLSDKINPAVQRTLAQVSQIN